MSSDCSAPVAASTTRRPEPWPVGPTAFLEKPHRCDIHYALAEPTTPGKCPCVFPIIEDRPGGDTSYFNNVPQAILAQAELPAFKFELEKSAGKEEDGSYGREPMSPTSRSRQA